LPQPRFLDKTTPPTVFTLTVVAGLGALSMNIFLPSLPEMTEYFGTTYGLMQLSVALYLGVTAFLQILVGQISDRYGRRPVLLGAMSIFTLASIGCLLAPTAEIFLFFRMMQAIVAAGLVLSRAAIRDMVPVEEAASKIAYVTMGMALVPMIGPALGGFLDEIFGWKANFWTLIILGALTVILIYRDLGETAPLTQRSFKEQLSQYPELLRSPRFWGYAAAGMFASGTFFSYLGGAPFVGDEIYHLSSSALGIFFGAPAVGYLIGNFIVGRFGARIGLNKMILAGAIVATIGPFISLVLHLIGIANPYSFFIFMTFVGFGNGMVLPNANAGVLSVRPSLSGSAAGLASALMFGGGAILSGRAGAIMTVESGATPLLMMMTLCSTLSIVAILLVMLRARKTGPLDEVITDH
jgi:DHA1 family bicyclomycin/chloramphenicol resistance-like MFS transporter